MAGRILDGREVAEAWRGEVLERLAALRGRGIQPAVAVVRVGDDESAVAYGRTLARTFERAGVGFRLEALPADTAAAAAAELLQELSHDPSVHGIMLQEPVPAPLSADELVLAIDPAKDVDGVHPRNAGELFQGRGGGFVPATALGGMRLLDHYGVALQGRRAVVIGRSTIVGRPLALLLLHRHATVTICHSRTTALADRAREAEVLAVAVGRPGFITADMVGPETVVLDFGTNYADGGLCGDVAPEVAEVAAAMTPTPGGTGTVTSVALLHNVVQAASPAK